MSAQISDPQDIETASISSPANAVLSIADEDTRNVEVLKRAALQRMALDYRRRDKRSVSEREAITLGKLGDV